MSSRGSRNRRAILQVAVFGAALLGPIPAQQPAKGATSYGDLVVADGATVLWRLGEPSGSVAADSIGTADGTYDGGVTRAVTSLVAGGDGAARFNGSDSD